MSGVSDAAVDAAAPASPTVETGGSVGGPPIVSPSPGHAAPFSASAAVSISDDALAAIKQQALAQLSPLVDKLEQTPEEKFRLTMSMIQASDDHSLIKTAYDAAEKIQDEKVRAESLLAIVNEVNYFSQKAAPAKPGDESPSL